MPAYLIAIKSGTSKLKAQQRLRNYPLLFTAVPGHQPRMLPDSVPLEAVEKT
jgi:hypothetical protein